MITMIIKIIIMIITTLITFTITTIIIIITIICWKKRYIRSGSMISMPFYAHST